MNGQGLSIGRALACFAAAILATSMGRAQQQPAAQQRLPATLTLEYALSLADELHPDMAQAQADVARAQAGLLRARSATGFEASLEARLRYVEPSHEATNQDPDDHALRFLARKRLYDFGRTDAEVAAAEANVRGAEQQFINARNEHRLKIMERYFDVRLADLAYLRDNEAMAVAYVRLDRLRDRRELGQVSDLDVQEQESVYQQARLARAASQAQQRATRALLAEAVNRPGQLPSELVQPKLTALDRELPEVEQLQAEAEKNNPLLLALRQDLEAARAQLVAARAGDSPVLDGELEASGYTRSFGSRDTALIGLSLKIPLSTGGATEAAVAAARAAMQRAEAEFEGAARSVAQAVLNSWLELDLARVRRDESQARLDYRELYLDRSRALYELEVATDLGDSMVQISEAQRRVADAEYRIALAWGRLDALLGKPVQP